MGHPQKYHFPDPQVKGRTVEQLVDHLRPPGEYMGGVGEQSEHIQIAAARHPLADLLRLLVGDGERHPRHGGSFYFPSGWAARTKVQSRVTKGSSTVVPSGATPGS